VPIWAASSSRHARQAGDSGIIADGGDRFPRHVARALDSPFVVLFEQDGSDEPDDGAFVWDRSAKSGGPTTSVRRLISPLRRSSGLVL
jgi:hypothetical protein